MDMSPLTEPQVRQISALVAARRLVEVDPDPARCEAFLRLAEDTISDVVHVRLPQNRYNLAYDSAHAVGEAMLARHGLRTTNGQGQHEALARFLRIVFDRPPDDAHARHVDRMRRARNQMHDDARPVSTTDADQAVATATALLAVAKDDAP